MFFIKSPDAKMAGIETYLKKRDYVVTIETDIKEALVKMIELQPAYVFLAFDHPNPKIANISAIIDQSIITTIIAFVHTNTKESMRKINFSGYKHKLYPPMSGPAIERLVLKIEKEKTAETESAAATTAASEQYSRQQKNTDEIIQVKSKAIEKLNAEMSHVSGDRDEKSGSSIVTLNADQKKRRTLSLRTKRKLYANFPRRPLAVEQKSNLKKTFENEIVSDLSDIESSYETEPSNIAYMPQHRVEKLGGISMINKQSTLCLAIESETWTGFVIGSTDGEIDAQIIGPLLIKWISAVYPEAIDNENYDFFNIQVDQVKLGEWARAKADHYEVTKFRDFSIMMSAFSIEPHELTFNVVDQHDLLEVPMNIIKPDIPLEFNLHLYLPENNKYILYALADYEFGVEQKRRLLDKKVSNMFASVEAEQQVKQLKIDFLFDQLLDKLQKESNL